jgi:hypothetical protein
VPWWIKTIQFAPVIFATSAVGLLVIKIEDPGIKRILRAIAILLGVGTAFSLIVQAPAVLAAVESGYTTSLRILGFDEESHLARIRRDAAIEAARVKAETETYEARAKADRERLLLQQRIEQEKQTLEATVRKAKADATAEAEARRRAELRAAEEAAAAQRRMRAAAQAERDENARRAAEWRAANGGCDPGWRQQCMSVGSSGGGPRQTLGCSCVRAY